MDTDRQLHESERPADDLESRGMDGEAVSELQELFATFNRGPIETVLPALHVYATTLGVEGRRETG